MSLLLSKADSGVIAQTNGRCVLMLTNVCVCVREPVDCLWSASLVNFLQSCLGHIHSKLSAARPYGLFRDAGDPLLLIRQLEHWLKRQNSVLMSWKGDDLSQNECF